MRAYVILVDGTVSFEGYFVLQNAINFIKSRPDKPVQDCDTGSLWRYKSPSHVYLIKEINLK